MARGMVVNEAITSQAATDEYRRGFAGALGCAHCGGDGTDGDPIVWRCSKCGARLCKDCLSTQLDCYDTGRKCLGCDDPLPDSDGNAPTDWAFLGYGVEKKGGRWIWDEQAQKLVRAEDYVPPQMARNADIMVDRFMEGQTTADGVDISSRAKRRAYMQAHGVADYDDFKEVRAKARAEKEARRRGEFKPDPQLRETIGRALYREKKIL